MSDRAVYKDWVVKALHALGPSKPKDVFAWIRRNELVDPGDLHGSTSDGENLFEKNVRWARFDLRHESVVVSPSRGVWALARSKP